MSIAAIKKALDKKYEKREKETKEKTYVTFDDITSNQVSRHHTGSFNLDYIFGGGIPAGVVNFLGPESGGKSALAQLIGGQYYKDGLLTGYNDNEHTIDVTYALKTFGYDLTDGDKVIFSQEEYGAIIYDTVEMGINNGVKLFTIDSENGMMTAAQDAAEYDEAQMTQHARLNSFALMRLKGLLIKNDATLIIVSQLRDKIGGQGGEGTSGGHALKFYSSVRARISRAEFLKKGDEIIGQKIRVKVWKNKTAPPFRECEIDLYYNKGIDYVSEMVDMALRYDIIKQGGAWYYYNGEKYQGKKSVIDFMNENQAAYNRVREQVLTAIKSVTPIVNETKSVEDPDKIAEIESEDGIPDTNSVALEEGKKSTEDSIEEKIDDKAKKRGKK